MGYLYQHIYMKGKLNHIISKYGISDFLVDGTEFYTDKSDVFHVDYIEINTTLLPEFTRSMAIRHQCEVLLTFILTKYKNIQHSYSILSSNMITHPFSTGDIKKDLKDMLEDGLTSSQSIFKIWILQNKKIFELFNFNTSEQFDIHEHGSVADISYDITSDFGTTYGISNLDLLSEFSVPRKLI